MGNHLVYCPDHLHLVGGSKEIQMSKPNFKNHTIWTGDNLPIMRGLNSESVDLIYLDRRSTRIRTTQLPLEARPLVLRSRTPGRWTM